MNKYKMGKSRRKMILVHNNDFNVNIEYGFRVISPIIFRSRIAGV